VVKSSSLIYGADREDPGFFREDMKRTRYPRNAVERSLLAVEDYVRDFAVDNPHVTVSLLRFSNVLGPAIRTPISQLLNRRFAGLSIFDQFDDLCECCFGPDSGGADDQPTILIQGATDDGITDPAGHGQ